MSLHSLQFIIPKKKELQKELYLREDTISISPFMMPDCRWDSIISDSFVENYLSFRNT